MKKRVIASLLCMAMGLSLVACGGKETTTTTTTTEKAETKVEEKTEDKAADTAAEADAAIKICNECGFVAHRVGEITKGTKSVHVR